MNQKPIPTRVLVELQRISTHVRAVRFSSERFYHNLFTLLVLVLLCVAGTTGCAVSMAIEQPTKKNLSVLDPGTPRALVVSEFGRPVATRTVKKRRDGNPGVQWLRERDSALVWHNKRLLLLGRAPCVEQMDTDAGCQRQSIIDRALRWTFRLPL